MFKFLAIVILFITSSYVGYYFGEIFKSRSEQLKVLQKSLILMNSEILYTNTPLPMALANVANKLTGPFQKIYLDISEKLKVGNVDSVYECFNMSYQDNKDQFQLKKEDLIIMKDFFSSLGESGIYGQEKIFNLTLERLKRNYDEAENDAKINTKMYRTLGICAGAILAIFFI